MESLNRIALQAMAGAQALNNPGPGDPSQQMLEQLQQLAEQQGELTNQSESVVPMELSQAAREAQAQQIAEGQDTERCPALVAFDHGSEVSRRR